MMNNLTKVIAAVIALTMISGALLVFVPGTSISAGTEDVVIDDQIAAYSSPEFRDRKATDLRSADYDLTAVEKTLSGESILAGNLPLNTTKPFVTSADYWDQANSTPEEQIIIPYYNIIDMTKRGEGQHCELWIADDLTFFDPLAARNSRVDIDQSLVDYMIEEFDDNIYPVMNDTFIDAPPFNGSSPDLNTWKDVLDNDTLTLNNISDMLYPTADNGKVMIMVFNIIDTNWYGLSNTYTVGYYWSTIRDLYNRNIIHIDCYDWANRTGPQEDEVIDGVGHWSYVYESTFAHEYQHLLHDVIDSDESTWVNEGLSMMSESICGYPVDVSYLEEFLYYPENSLTVWGDAGSIIADYGAVFMFMMYLSDHYGGTEMLQTIFNCPANGVDSINEAFLDMGLNRMTFQKVYHDWRLANLMWDSDVGGGLYDYKSVSMDGPWIWEIMSSSYFSIDRDDNFGYIEEYGTDYFMCSLQNIPAERSKFVFDGDDYAHVGWEFVDQEAPGALISMDSYWNSGRGNMIDNVLTLDLNLSTPAEGGEYLHSLIIDSSWNIELDWDYGFVQVSTDGGATWTTLNDTGDYCTATPEPGALDSIVDNLPGLTGVQTERVDVTYDLSAYDGQEITVGFRYMTDTGTFYSGWNIFGASVDGEEIPMDEFYAPIGPETDFMVTLVFIDEDSDKIMIVDVPTMDLDETGTKLLGTDAEYDLMIVLVSAIDGPAGYSFGLTQRGNSII